MPNFFDRFQSWLDKLLGARKPVDTLARPTGLTGQIEHVNVANAQSVLPYDENLMERARTQWQFGDWESLTKLERDTFQHHPDRAKLALLAAAGHLQTGNTDEARQFLRLARDWGVSKNLIGQILIAGVHNSIGCATILADQKKRSLAHFKSAIRTGTPGSEFNLLAEARSEREIARLTGQHGHMTTMVQPRLNSFGIQTKRAIVRSIHHLSCTGGTLFAKCLAAMSKTVVLNEIDPHSTLALDANGQFPFQPRDIISLLRQSNADLEGSLIDDIFLNDIATITSKLDEKGTALVLRDHAHSAYLTGEHKRQGNNLGQLIQRRFQLRAVVTVRDPIDSYLSLLSNEWIHYTPPTFDEYCKRYIQFIEDNRGLKVFKYESFVASPQRIMRELTDELHLEYSPDFESHFYDFKFSGDSGRSGNLIEPRSRREYNDGFIAETKLSHHYQTLIKLLDYPALC